VGGHSKEMSLNMMNTTVDFYGEATNCERRGAAGIVCPVKWRKQAPSSVMFVAQGTCSVPELATGGGLENYKSVCLIFELNLFHGRLIYSTWLVR